MSVTIETIITCDGCEGTFNDGDSRNESAAIQRSEFDVSGWIYRYGRDYCPVCAARLFKKKIKSGWVAPE